MAYSKRKHLGQHFLKDAQVVETLVGALMVELQNRCCHYLLEIGPGKGALTSLIRERLKSLDFFQQFFLCEKDELLAKKWEQLGVGIHVGDFLDCPTHLWLKPALAVVSNLPYSSSIAILKKLVSEVDTIRVMVLMFQAEVAFRLRAEAGNRNRGSLSLAIQNRWDVHFLLKVPPCSFDPAPCVDSEVLLFIPRSHPRIEGSDTAEGQVFWELLLRKGFAQPRKMLRRVFLSQWLGLLDRSGVDGSKRAFVLDWAEWNALFQARAGLKFFLS